MAASKPTVLLVIHVFALFIRDKAKTLDRRQAVSKPFLIWQSPLLTQGTASRHVAGFLRRLVSQRQLPEFRISWSSIPDEIDGVDFSILAGNKGLEPLTNGLTVRCSTD